MSELQEVQFNQRITNSGFLFIISGISTFFALNNYAPYSYFAEQEPISPQDSFFNPTLLWYTFVLLHYIFLLAVAVRFFSINKEIKDLRYLRFSILFLLSVSLSFSIIIVLFILGLMPVTVYIPYRTEIGLGYLVVNIGAQIIQIVAWIIFYKIGRDRSTQLGKDVYLNFMSTPIFLIIADLIALGAYVISFIASGLVLSGLDPTPFDMIGTLVHFGWIIITTLVYFAIGIRILNKPSIIVEKSHPTSKYIEIKKVRLSCPNCHESIFEDQKVCYNCGYRIK